MLSEVVEMGNFIHVTHKVIVLHVCRDQGLIWEVLVYLFIQEMAANENIIKLIKEDISKKVNHRDNTWKTHC